MRTGSRWHLRVALSLVLLFDLALLTGMLCTADPLGPRLLARAPGILHALAGQPALVLPIALAGLVALALFAARPGRIGAAVAVLASIAVL
ncbi:MAG: hypothetical protein M3Y87_27835, partial [Myxococcota bacterium]|nr:hypothetical protein [Myxococcota bacterium]